MVMVRATSWSRLKCCLHNFVTPLLEVSSKWHRWVIWVSILILIWAPSSNHRGFDVATFTLNFQEYKFTVTKNNFKCFYLSFDGRHKNRQRKEERWRWQKNTHRWFSIVTNGGRRIPGKGLENVLLKQDYKSNSW